VSRLLVAYFLILSLLPNFEGAELLKLPGLITHYLEHKAGSENLGWDEFISEHYGNTDHASGSDHKHQKLPFKTHDCSLHQMVALGHDIPQYCFFCPSQTQTFFIELHGKTRTYQESFWQPPRQSRA
jgi:hypothetical protein